MHLPSALGLLLLASRSLAEASSEEASLIDVASHASNQSLLWGTYRPNLYFGMRPRMPASLMTGMMWWGATDFTSYGRARHACDQGDELGGYAWTKHDGRNSGSQVIRDLLNNVILTTEFLKVPGGEHGGSWAVRVKGEPIKRDRPSRISLVQYFGLEGLGTLEMDSEEDEEGIDGAVKFSGSTTRLGNFNIRIEDSPDNIPLQRGPHSEDFGESLERSSFIGIQVPHGDLWKAKDAILGSMTNRVQTLLDKYTRNDLPDPAIVFALPNEVRYGSNLYAIERTYQAPFQVDFFYDSASSPPSTKLSPASLSAGLEASFAAFDQRFDRAFPLIKKEFTPDQVLFAQEMTSSMLGGIGYFYGSSIVDRDFAHDYDDDGLLAGDSDGPREARPQMTEEKELFTATPSRSFFPRGFYWDEGFHLLLVGAWDNDLSLDILKSWVNLIDRDGWVGREQILGEEARSKVPQEFRTQYPHHANPPTLTMAVTAYVRRLRSRGTTLTDADLGMDTDRSMLANVAASSDAEALANRFVDDAGLAKAFLLSLYPKLRRHYEWFRETQRGQIREWGRSATSKTEAYRWRGRTVDHVLTSGLDDYPRARPPHQGELHLDLISWMAFFTRTMSEIAEFVGEEDDLAEYQKTYKLITANIEDLHWNEEKRMYCDVSVDEDDESYHVCHKGYISIFPFLLGLLPADSPHLDAILDDIQDPEELWSDYGIRSLAKSDPFFGEGENYWRGPVWIPLNYMALSSLHNIYAKQPGPYQQKAATIYSRLRENIITNVYKEWKRTGFTWEQFDATTGEGRRSKPFTGWTAMVAMIMAEDYQ